MSRFLKWTTVVLLVVLVGLTVGLALAGWPPGAWQVVYSLVGAAFLLALFGYLTFDRLVAAIRKHRDLTTWVGWLGQALLICALVAYRVEAPPVLRIVRDVAAVGCVLCFVVWAVLRYRSRAAGRLRGGRGPERSDPG